MKDGDLFSDAPDVTPVVQALPAASAAPTSGPAPLPQTTDADLLARTALAEGDKGDPQSWQNVAGVVLNRAHATGKSVAEILAEPGQFEAYGNGHIQAIDPKSPAYQAAMQAIQPVLTGAVKVPYDSFYQPDIVAARGVKPPFAATNGTKIGSQVFGNAYKGADFTLSPEDAALWNNLHGGAGVQIEPGKGYGGSGQPTNQIGQSQQDAIKFLSVHGFQDPNAPGGSSTNPTALPQGAIDAQIPDGTWYINHSGQLRKGGDATPDYLPGYQAVAKQQSAVAAQPWYQRGATDVGQGFADVAGSVNKLLGGGLAVDNPTYAALGQGMGGPSAYDLASGSKAAFDLERNKFNLSHYTDPLATPGRVVGQLAASTPLMLAGEGALGAGGEMLARAAPEAAPLVDFAGSANPLATAGRNAAQGAGYAGLTSETSDRPLGEQLATGAALNTGFGLAGQAGGKLLDKTLGGSVPQTVAPDVAGLADAAVNKYGIPLRAGQVAGVENPSLHYADSNMLQSNGKFQTNNAVQRDSFMKGVTGTYGDPSGDVSPEVLQANKDRIGGVMNDVASRTNIANADVVQTRVGQIISDAQKVLPDNEVKPLLNMAQNIGDVRSGSVIPGDAYQALTRKGAPLDRLSSSADPNVAHYAGQIREALDDGLQNSATPEDVRALQNARWQYKNLMTVAKLAPKADAATGVISPALLRGAVNTNFKNAAFQGAGSLGELAQIGQTFMKEPPQSGSAERLAAKANANPLLSLVTGPVGALGITGEALGSLIHDPVLGAKAVALGLAGKGIGAANQALRERALGAQAGNKLINRSLGRTPQNRLAVPLAPAATLGTNLFNVTPNPSTAP